MAGTDGGVKKCYACGGTKPHAAFYRDRSRGDGLAATCKACNNAAAKARRQRRAEAHRQYARAYYQKNAGRVIAYMRLRKLALERARPKWADEQALEAKYALARRATELMDEPHEVDHEIPLVSPEVCGLHVPENLRVVPKALNARKGNRYWW